MIRVEIASGAQTKASQLRQGEAFLMEGNDFWVGIVAESGRCLMLPVTGGSVYAKPYVSTQGEVLCAVRRVNLSIKVEP